MKNIGTVYREDFSECKYIYIFFFTGSCTVYRVTNISTIMLPKTKGNRDFLHFLVYLVGIFIQHARDKDNCKRKENM